MMINQMMIMCMKVIQMNNKIHIFILLKASFTS